MSNQLIQQAEEKNMKSRMVAHIGTHGLLLWLASVVALGQTTLSIPGLPGTLNWQNTPRSWNIDGKNSLDTELPVRVGFESQSPAGPGAVASFSANHL